MHPGYILAFASAALFALFVLWAINSPWLARQIAADRARANARTDDELELLVDRVLAAGGDREALRDLLRQVR